ncbi:4-hydroxyproline epimerase [Microbulbifer taiwanensis]|uniref:4-hydroxyproline epimerase n=1 Tax=Microbulbifer taiwanensis TaxID=986746 RepID=A0ABW1YSD9_9GAMM|nr:4-hydroxyproline epimerase [Microbulbifer taiwanensis]
MHSIEVIDSHTGGEPTRVIVSGGPDLGSGTMAERLEAFRRDHDPLRAALVREPRGSDVLVGALLCEPVDRDCAAGVIFFNNVGYLGMCGHGTIGLAVTMARRGLIEPGEHRLETPVGEVSFVLHNNHRVSIDNVPSYRYRKQVAVDVEGIGTVRGDIAWGGNWFFLVSEHDQILEVDNTEQLTDYCWRIRQALERHGITGENGGEIDHIELFGPPSDPAKADSRNFVLCPGKAYDRSPCGTGTSAKLACLLADGIIKEGQVWRQESIIGSVFEGRVRRAGENVIPTISGSAYINAETKLVLEPEDPFVHGING